MKWSAVYKNRNRHKNIIKSRWQARLGNIPTTWRWAIGDAMSPTTKNKQTNNYNENKNQSWHCIFRANRWIWNCQRQWIKILTHIRTHRHKSRASFIVNSKLRKACYWCIIEDSRKRHHHRHLELKDTKSCRETSGTNTQNGEWTSLDSVKWDGRTLAKQLQLKDTRFSSVDNRGRTQGFLQWKRG